MSASPEQIKKWSDNYDNTIGKTDIDHYCNLCRKKINLNPYTGDCYNHCWCGLWWCCSDHADKEGFLFVGDAYDTDSVTCNHCRKKD